MNIEQAPYNPSVTKYSGVHMHMNKVNKVNKNVQRVHSVHMGMNTANPIAVRFLEGCSYVHFLTPKQ